ncbi:MAG: hypothetical protein EOS59_31790 [Mesorhizobium sp.]|nr:MAG: hypothetical protein EOS59_31790 [Mesorhizobium sp.]
MRRLTGKHIAAVATARKLAMIIWHMLTKDTRRHLGAVGHPRRGTAFDYNVPAKRAKAGRDVVPFDPILIRPGENGVRRELAAIAPTE